MRCFSGNHRRCRAAAAAAAGCLLAAVAQLAVAAGPGVHGRVLELDTEGKITGTVSGAAIEFKNLSGAAAGQATSGRGGYYRVDLPPGKYYYKVAAPGYKDEDHGRGIALERSEGYAVYNLSLIKGQNDPDWTPPVIDPVEVGKLSGHVWGAGPERGAARIGVPGAEISLRRTDGDRELVRVTSGDKDPKAGSEAGQYAIVLPAGAWKASVSAQGYQTLVDPQPIVIDPANPAVRDFLLTGLAPEPVRGQGIKGVITIDDPQLSPQAKSSVLSRVEVYTQRFRAAEARLIDPVLPDAKGNYSRDLPKGKYRVLAFAKGYKTGRSGPVDVFTGKYSVVNLTLVPDVEPEPPPVEMLVFQGTVYEQTAEGGKRRPLPGASVLIRRANQAMSDAPRGTTDLQGKVKLEVAAAGEYTVLAQKPGYEPGGTRVTIAPGAANSQAITLSRQSTPPEPVPPRETVAVTGYVVYHDATSPTGYRGAKGARVTWTRPGSQNLPAVADLTGKFSLKLQEGTYGVSVEPPPGFTGVGRNVEVRRGMKPEFFILQRGEEPQPEQLVRVQGYVMTPSPTSRGYTAVPGAKIIWGGGPRRPLPTLTSDRSGQFSIDLPQGTYDVTVQAPPGYEGMSKVVVVQQGMGTVSLVLRRGQIEPEPQPGQLVRVQGYVQTPSLVSRGYAPVAGAKIVWGGGPSLPTVISDDRGLFSIDLPQAGYDVTVQAPRGYQNTSKRVIVRQGMERVSFVLQRDGRPPGPMPTPLAELTVRVLMGRVPALSPPLPGAEVVILQNNQTIDSGRTNMGGNASFRLKPGSYEIQARAKGFRTGRQMVMLPAGVTKKDVFLIREGDVTPEPEGQVAFTIRVLGIAPAIPGAPTRHLRLAGANVTLKRNRRNVLTGQTNEGGEYSGRMPAGRYQVSVTRQGYDGKEIFINLRREPVSQEIVLDPKSESSGPRGTPSQPLGQLRQLFESPDESPLPRGTSTGPQ